MAVLSPLPLYKIQHRDCMLMTRTRMTTMVMAMMMMMMMIGKMIMK